MTQYKQLGDPNIKRYKTLKNIKLIINNKEVSLRENVKNMVSYFIRIFTLDCRKYLSNYDVNSFSLLFLDRIQKQTIPIAKQKTSERKC